MLLLVAIAVEGGDGETAVRVLESCQAALGPAACSAADGPGAASEPISATVTIEDASLRVSIEADSGGAVRQLQFSPEDSAEQRAVAAGLLVAALAADLERTAAARTAEAPSVRPPPPPPSPPIVPAPEPPPRTESRTRQWLLDVGAFASAPAGALAPHLGGQAQGGYFASSHFALFLGARADTALPGGLDASRLGLSLGLGMELLPQARRLSWLVQLDARIEELRLGGGLSEPLQASVLRGGGALSSRFGFPTRGAGFYLGLEGALIGPAVDVYVGTEPRGQVPLLSFSLLLGGRLASFRP